MLLHAAAKEAAKDGRVVIAQIAPAVRVAMAETMGLAPGEVSVGQLVTGLRQLGFDYVFGKFAGMQHQCQVFAAVFWRQLQQHL